MAEKTKMENGKPAPSASGTLTTSAIGQVGDLTERALSTCYSVARDTRAEILQRSLALIDFFQGTQESAFKIMRDAATRADKIALDLVDTSESLTVGALRSTRETLMGLTQFATRTSQLVTDTARESLPKGAPATA